MYHREAREEYVQAQRLGQREYKSLVASGQNPYPEVLDTILGGRNNESVQEVGLVEIPSDLIVGVKSAGRTTAFSASFLPLLSADSEFAYKWIELCAAHFSTGIRDPILCYEYLGKFYVQEGNKRVSVLKHMGAPRIPGTVRRVLPSNAEGPRVQAYYEFIDFYKYSGSYRVQFRHPGDYAKLLAALGKAPGEAWDEREKKTFSSYFQYFREAFLGLDGALLDLLPEEALLLWLQVYPFRDLGRLSTKELKKTLSALWDDFVAISQQEPATVHTEPADTGAKSGILSRILSGAPDHVHVAFVHPLDPSSSTWIKGHDQGRQYLENALGDRVVVRSYFHADTPTLAEALLEQAVSEGADVVFATTPQLRRSVLRAAVKYPKVRFLCCSADTQYSSIRTYYARIYEAKFITGAIAGAIAKNDRIGYVGSYPILGVPASINAFALGARLTNPRAEILLRWSCMAGDPQAALLSQGVRVISNRDMPTADPVYLDFCNYGTYATDDLGNLEPLASPVWLWGRLYENVVRSILAGTWEKDSSARKAVNYWWGMDSGVIDVKLSQRLPEGCAALADMLRTGIQTGQVDPFRRKILAQDGSMPNDGSRGLTPDELLRMDWLCDNVIGSIPEFEEIEPFAQPTVRELGIHRERIPVEKEGAL